MHQPGYPAVELEAVVYIDPNTGGMLFQILAVAFAALSGMIFFFSRQIKTISARFLRFLRSLFSRRL